MLMNTLMIDRSAENMSMTRGAGTEGQRWNECTERPAAEEGKGEVASGGRKAAKAKTKTERIRIGNGIRIRMAAPQADGRGRD
jgi:hypothetical protein